MASSNSSLCQRRFNNQKLHQAWPPLLSSSPRLSLQRLLKPHLLLEPLRLKESILSTEPIRCIQNTHQRRSC